MNSFFYLSYNELIFLSAILGNELANCLNSNQQNILGNFLEAVGQNILIANAVSSTYPPQSRGPDFGPPGVGQYGNIYRYGFRVKTSSGTTSTATTLEQNLSEENKRIIEELQKTIEEMQKKIDELERNINNNSRNK